MSRQSSAETVERSETAIHGSVRERAILPILVRIAAGITAIALLLAAARLPIWRALFSAPQYPQGLEIAAYGNKVEGDLDEINELSHYIGMPPFDFVGMPEMRLWPLVILVGAIAVVLALATRRRWLRRLSCVTVWLIPVGALVDVQFRLWQVGHSLDPMSAIRVAPFTPRVLGPTDLMNFTIVAFPGTSLILIAVAAALVTATPVLARRVTRRTGLATDPERTHATPKAQ